MFSPVKCARSCLSNTTFPAVGSYTLMTAKPVVDLPQPLSPTSPSVSPRWTWKLTPSTALTAPTCRERGKPRKIGKCTFKSWTSSRGEPPLDIGAPMARVPGLFHIYPTSAVIPRRDRHGDGPVGRAFLDAKRAAGDKRAALRRVGEIGRASAPGAS